MCYDWLDDSGDKPEVRVEWVEKLQVKNTWVERDGHVEQAVTFRYLQVYENETYWSATMANSVCGEIDNG